MKKITLTINGKEQTFTEGSVVEVVTKKESYHEGAKYVGYLSRHFVEDVIGLTWHNLVRRVDGLWWGKKTL